MTAQLQISLFRVTTNSFPQLEPRTVYHMLGSMRFVTNIQAPEVNL